MKLLIAGSRSIKQFDLAQHIPPETELIISGGAFFAKILIYRGAPAGAERSLF